MDDRNKNLNDPYEQEQRRLRQMFDEVPTDEEEDPYNDSDGEYGSDQNYEPSSESSSSESAGLSSQEEPQNDIENTEEEIPDEDDDANWEDTTAEIPEFFFDETHVGLKADIGPNSTPEEVFMCLFTEEILQYIVDSSNEYGESLTKINRPKTRNSRSASFKFISLEEMKNFLGLCLLQGQIATTNVRRYFSASDVLYYHPVFPYIMSGRRFETILRVMCCSDRKAQKKAKVQALIDMLLSSFRAAYSPTKELSLDESLLHFRGRLGFRVYIKGKKDRYGIKFFELTTSNGYLLNLEMYSGSDPDGQGISKTEAVVMRLMNPFLMRGHELYMDNYYNSVSLSQKLLKFRTHTTGTLRSNRKDNPTTLTKKKMKKGEHFWVRKKQVYVSKWKDKRDVLLITTKHHPRLAPARNRFGKEKIKPIEVTSYNNHMAGIDRCDQMISTYSTPRKTIRWYKKVMLYLLDVAVWNAFFLYRKYCRQPDNKVVRFIQFRDLLIKSLIKLPSQLRANDLIVDQKPVVVRTKNIQPPKIPEGHWPAKISGNPVPPKKSIFQKCRMCTRRKQRKETSYRCKGCDGKPPLCPGCFEEWHTSS